jgi:hypothetical protein
MKTMKKILLVLNILLITGCSNVFYPEIKRIGFTLEPHLDCDPPVGKLFCYYKLYTYALIIVDTGFYQIYDGETFDLVGNGWIDSTNYSEIKHYVMNCHNNLKP